MFTFGNVDKREREKKAAIFLFFKELEIISLVIPECSDSSEYETTEEKRETEQKLRSREMVTRSALIGRVPSSISDGTATGVKANTHKYHHFSSYNNKSNQPSITEASRGSSGVSVSKKKTK